MMYSVLSPPKSRFARQNDSSLPCFHETVAQSVQAAWCRQRG
jgi:hypothetical protein